LKLRTLSTWGRYLDVLFFLTDVKIVQNISLLFWKLLTYAFQIESLETLVV